MKSKHIIGIVLCLSLGLSEASALSFRFGEEGDTSAFGKIVGSLFVTGKTGAALVGEISDIATTTFSLTTKQKTYTIAYTPETKVRKLGLPAKISDVKEGDKVSVVSSLVKADPKYPQAKLRAKIVSILSQEGEAKFEKKDSKKDEEKGEEVSSSTDAQVKGGEGKDEDRSEKEEKGEKMEKFEKKDASATTSR